MHIQEKTDFLFCFWFCDSCEIIVTFLSSLEPADSECDSVYFTSHNNNVHTLSCLYNIDQYRKSNYVKKFQGHHMLSLSLSLFGWIESLRPS